ncbi:MAG: M1 family metallopeptidase [Firmicutes bacterium]|nr:M1 family metallopeptidase [Bacillota bacterium]
MKKIIILIFITIILTTGCGVFKEEYNTLIVEDLNNIQTDKIDTYDIDVLFNPDKKTYTAKQRVKYINKENNELDRVYFHIYPNAFKYKETAPFLFDDFNSAYPNGFSKGYIKINKITIEDKKVNFLVFGKGDTILKVPLNEKLKPEESVEINMEYEVLMPPARDRFGYGEKTFNFGNWYPIAAVYDDDGWNLDPYYSVGDPFYSDVSNFNVKIKAPKDYIIASSGNIIKDKEKDDFKIWEIDSDLMRDFAWVASKDFIVESKDVDGTLVKVYLLNENENINNFALDVSCNSIKTFNTVFGKYPYGSYSVVQTSFPSGMEYPGIVFIGEKYYNENSKGYLETVIAHETAHQWWYGVVGNNEVDEAWLDESLTSYSEVIYANEIYGKDVADKYYNDSIKKYYNTYKGMTQSKENIVKPLNEFNNWDDYGPLVYGKGAIFVHEIKNQYGEETLYKILKEYYNRNRFLNANTNDFLKICEEITGDDLDSLINSWIYGK